MPRPFSVMRVGVALVGAALAGGCKHASPGPEVTLGAYLAALSAGRLDDAYALLGSEYQKTHDRSAFERLIGTPDARAAAARLRKAPAEVELRAEVELPDGERLPLVQEHGAWRLARDPLDFYPQRAPAEALRSFIRAVENHRYEIVLRFVPNRYRSTFTVDKLRDRWEGERRADVVGQLAAVRAHLGDPLEIAGDEARLTVGERKQARLVREDGAWRVETLE